MKKIYLKAYLNTNLGDDIFIDIITKRYPNTCFEELVYNKQQTKFEKNFNQIEINKKLKIINKVIKIISKNKNELEKIVMKKNDATILIGGSMFIENNNNDKPYFIGEGKPYYIIGANFGPYYTQKYYKKFYSIFKNAEDVCFREKYSYGLFKELKNVRHACDIIFGLDIKKIKKEKNKRVVISVINCEKKQNKDYKSKYEKLIIDLIKKFDNMNYNITLMSFCKNEGDEDAIKEILSKIGDNELKNNIEQYNYNGNIEEALNILGKAEIIVGSRFHANILGLVMNKTILPIAYSDKTINTLKDINFKGKIIDIRKIDEFNINDLKEKDLNYKINIDKYKKEAEKHFEKLDEFLKD